MKIRVYISLLIFFLLFVNVAVGQLEATNWYFGPNCSALKFSSTGVTTVLPNGYTPYGAEGCSVLSDPKTGALRFYTDGGSVVDANHRVMPNGFGLITLSSSWGSGKVAVDPQDCNRFYIFHNDGASEGGGQRKLFYSMVDMKLPGNGTVFNPQGDVAPSKKNILIGDNVAEGVEVIPVANSHDFWLLGTSNSPSSVTVYRFTASGSTLINTFSLLNSPSDVRAIRFCEANNKISIASCNDFDDVLVMDFNTTTGEITNQSAIPNFPAGVNGAYHGVYDVCWSPNGTKLYISKYRQAGTGGKLYQHDFSTKATTLIYDVNPNSNSYAARGLKVGPDGKMYFLYMATDGQVKFIGAVNNPNNPAATCNFNSRQINMGVDMGNANKFPDFLYISDQLKNYPDTLVTVKTPCSSTTVEIDVNLNLSERDTDNDKLTYSILSTHLPTAAATLTTKGFHYKNNANPPYTDTVTIQYCDDFCIQKCKIFHVIVKVTTGGMAALNLPDAISSCDNQAVQLDAGAGLINYLWSTGETTQKISVATSGVYKITAADSNGCLYADSTIVSFKPKLTLSLGKDTSVCDSLVLKLGSPFSEIIWSNGSTAPSFIIRKSGTYSVQVKNADGCTGKDTISVIIHPPPSINLGGPFSYCQNIPINHVFQVTGMKSVVWSTGSTSNSINVTTPGVYTVHVTDMNGCETTDEATIAVKPSPIAKFNITNVCEGISQLFVNSSTIAAGGKLKCEWDFGDASVHAVDSLTFHTFATVGLFSVKLLVTADNGCRDSVVHPVSVYNLPKVDFDYKIVCPGTQLLLQNNTSSPTPVISWEWDFGDGTKDPQKNPMHTYFSKGDYLVKLTAKTDKGCAAELVKQVSVKTPPKADFRTKNNCEGAVVFLEDKSSFDATGDIKFFWNFNDGTPVSTQKAPQHIYTKAGTYFIKLLLLSNGECSDSITKKIIINPNPKAEFSATNVVSCSPLVTNFKDLSTIATGKIISWQWSLGNRNSTIKDPENVYRSNSQIITNYNIKLMVTSDSGCTSDLLKPNYISVYPSPTANFSLTPKVVSISNAVITFKNNSTGADSALWDFGDQLTSSIFDTPPHQYTDAQKFVVTLIVYNAYGCTDTTSREVIVQPEFTFYIPNSFTPNGDGLNEVFFGKGNAIDEFEMTIFNRWGNIMFTTNDIHIPWDGSKNNKRELAGEDVYVYTVSITDSNKKKHFYRGTVTLVR